MASDLAAALPALAAGTLGGFAFRLLDLPLPWTLGALTAVGALAAFGWDIRLPRLLGTLARPIVGVLAGSAFTAAVVAQIPSWWPILLYVVAFSLLATLAGFFFFRRLAGLDGTTALFAAIPGGLSELSLLGASAGADLRSLVLVHSIRIVAVVFVVPFTVRFIAGPLDTSGLSVGGAAAAGLLDWVILASCALLAAAIGQVTKLPGGVIIPAMLLSAGAHALDLTHAAPPDWLVAAVQVLIGSMAGARFSGVRWRELGRFVTLVLVWTAVLLGITLLSARLGSALFGLPIEVMILALAPGGVVEMTLVVYALGLEVALVVACQITRIFTVLTAAPFLARRFLRTGG